MTTHTAVLDSVPRSEDVATAYDALAGEVDAPASMRWAAVGAWLRVQPASEPLLVLVRRDERLVGAATLAVRATRLGRRIEKAGVPGEPYSLLYVDDEARHELAEAVDATLRERRGGWRLYLTDLPAEDPCVQDLARRLGQVRRAPEAGTPVLDVGPGRTGAPVSPNTRRADLKARHRITREGHRLDLAWTGDATRVEALLPLLIRLHVRRNEQLGRTAQLRDPREHDLFVDTVLSQARSGRVRLLTALIDGQIAAFAICLVTAERWWVYANYADPDWLHFSPGTIANAEVVRAAYADPAARVLDWGQGVQRYKLSGGARLERRESIAASSPLLGVLRKVRRWGR